MNYRAENAKKAQAARAAGRRLAHQKEMAGNVFYDPEMDADTPSEICVVCNKRKASLAQGSCRPCAKGTCRYCQQKYVRDYVGQRRCSTCTDKATALEEIYTGELLYEED